MPMLEKIRATILKYNMLEAGDSVVVGVSGGADSAALLHVLLSLQDELSINVKAAHLNHKLRGDESERDQTAVEDLCKRLRVKLVVESADVAAIAKGRGLSIEEAGRNARYDFFARCKCDSIADDKIAGGNRKIAGGNRKIAGGNRKIAGGNRKIATAHSLNDSVETLLLNLARGTALRGLCGIPPTRGNIIRPLIECERVEIEAYCGSHGLGFVTDSSNLSDDFARNKIRHHAIPAILSVNEGFWKHMAGTLAALRQDADFLDALAKSQQTEDRSEYLSLGISLRYRILSQMLAQYGISVDGSRLARLDALIESGCGTEQLTTAYFFEAGGSGFGIRESREAAKAFCLAVKIPNEVEMFEIDVFSDKKLRLMNTDYEYYEENIKYIAKGLKNALDCDKIVGSLVLRQKMPGDSVRLCGRNCTKTLRKLFQEKKLTQKQRERLFILADDAGVIWAEGFGAAERASISDKTENILCLEIIESIRKGQNL